MKTVSLTDLKGSVTDVEADLGLNDPSKEIHLTDAQVTFFLLWHNQYNKSM